MIHGEAAFTGPFYVDIDLTGRCNMSCLGCQFHSSKTKGPSPNIRSGRDMTFELIQQLGGEFSRSGISEIIICGEGEPFLHPRLFDIISLLKGVGLCVQLYTNGTLINETNGASILESGLDFLKVSLWASSEEGYTRCYPGVKADNFQKTLNGIKLVSSLKEERQQSLPSVILTGPINLINYRHIEERIMMARALGCDGVTFTPYKHRRGEFASVALSTEQIALLHCDLVKAKKLLESHSLNHNIDTLLLQYRLGEAAWLNLPCYAGWFHSHIRFDGTVMPCCRCYISLGNLNENSFEEIWNGRAYRDFRVKSVTKQGLASLSSDCDCDWCNLVPDNFQVHRLYKWIHPLMKRKR